MARTRAVSTTLSYTLTLAISALLVSGLIVAGGSYVDDRREQVIRDELTVIGQQLAADIERTDRLANAGDGDTSLTVNQSVPDQVTGTGYRVTVDEANQELVLESFDPEVEVTIGFVTDLTVAESTAGPGTVEISYVESSNELEIDNV